MVRGTTSPVLSIAGARMESLVCAAAVIPGREIFFASSTIDAREESLDSGLLLLPSCKIDLTSSDKALGRGLDSTEIEEEEEDEEEEEEFDDS